MLSEEGGREWPSFGSTDLCGWRWKDVCGWRDVIVESELGEISTPPRDASMAFIQLETCDALGGTRESCFTHFS